MTFFLLATMTVAGGGILQEVNAVNEGGPIFGARLGVLWLHGASLHYCRCNGHWHGAFGTFAFRYAMMLGLKGGRDYYRFIAECGRLQV